MSLRYVWIVCGGVGLAAAGSCLRAAGWRTLEGTAYVENPANDGDSFHAKRNTRDYVLRLYFVDAPETDDRFPERLKEQADYFGVTVEQVVAGGVEAARRVEERIKDKKLEVHTRYEDARGAGRKKRYYAMVRVEERWISEWLVEQGLARVHGVGRDLPDGSSAQKQWNRLRKLEKEAKEAKRGLWGVAAGTVVMKGLEDGATMILPAQTPIFGKDPPHRMVGQLPKGWEVKVGPKTRAGFREVTFTSPGGNEFTGEIQELSLP